MFHENHENFESFKKVKKAVQKKKINLKQKFENSNYTFKFS